MTRIIATPGVLALAARTTVAAPAAGAYSLAGHGENQATVQSAFDGLMYVRATPADDYGDAGRTEVFRVGRDRDEKVDAYATHLRGELLLGWSPLAGKYGVVQIEPVRITDANQWLDVGRVAQLAFYMDGKLLKAYTREQLATLGVERRVIHLDNHLPGDFVVRGVVQLANSNRYALRVEHNDEGGKPVVVDFDITTGAVVAGP